MSGHSAAGKSTLLRLIATIGRPTSGTVVVNGQNIAALRRSALPHVRRRMGLVFQDQKLLYDRSVYDNVMLPLAFSDHSPKEAARRARKCTSTPTGRGDSPRWQLLPAPPVACSPPYLRSA